MDATMEVKFELVKNLDDFESVRCSGGMTIPVKINGTPKEDYKAQYNKWMSIIRTEVIAQTYDYYRAVKTTKTKNLEK